MTSDLPDFHVHRTVNKWDGIKMSTVIIDSIVLKSMREVLCKYPAECGGVIACNPDGIIVDFYFDHEAGTGNMFYSPSVSAINEVVNNKWHSGGLRFAGVAHSHPEKSKLYPSNSDLRAAERILLNNEGLEEILLLIAMGENVKVWKMQLNQQLQECEIQVSDGVT